MRRPLWSSAEYRGVRGVEHHATSRGVRTSDHREALERDLGRLTVRTQEETVALHVTPGAGSEHRRDGHVRSRRLARADVEVRELELLDDVASLSRGCDLPGWQAR